MIGLSALFVFKGRQPSFSEGNSTSFVANAPRVAAQVDAQAQTLTKVKVLWQKGARLKSQRHFGDAAAAWKEALELKPKHPGIQQAIDKLPVEVSYSVVAAFGRSAEKCDVSYLNERQKRVRLKNVSLPWSKAFIVPKGQPLSITATSNSRKSPPVASIFIGGTAVSTADFQTLWWLGYPTQLSCRAKATYALPSVYPPTDEGSWRVVGDDANQFMAKVRGVFGEDTELLVAGASTIKGTDILMVTLTQAWERVTSDVRLEVAQDIHRAWKGIRTPVNGKQVYILMIGEDNQRLGGSKYPNGSQLWIVNQGKLGEIIAVPEESGNFAPSATDQQGEESESSALDFDQSAPSSDITSFRLQLSNAPDMDRFVSGVDYPPESKDTVKIFVTSEFSSLDHSLRLQLARRLLQIWQSTHSPGDPNTARIVLKAGDGTTVGGQQLMGAVWVED